jgi:hypothetical protein
MTNDNNQNECHDPLNYVKNIKELGGSEKMAEYQARYSEHYINKTVKDAIMALHLERFATKEDLIRLEKDIKQDMYSLESRLMAKIHRLDKKIDSKFSRHTIYTISAIVIFNLPAPAKQILAQLLHI